MRRRTIVAAELAGNDGCAGKFHLRIVGPIIRCGSFAVSAIARVSYSERIGLLIEGRQYGAVVG